MKKIPAIFLCVCIVSLVSCKKEETPAPFAEPGTIAVDVKGQREIFTVNAKAIKFTDNQTNRLTIEAHERIGSDMKGVVLNIYSTGAITSREYPMVAADYGTVEYQSNIYVSSWCPFIDSHNVMHRQGTITITEINATHVRGTFSAEAWDELLWLNSTVLSDGSFDISF
jgi:hypothetical protein